MIPDIDTQLASVIKSITDNVSPAVDPKNQLAQEQLYLSLATLNIIRQNLPHVHTYLRRDLEEHMALIDALKLAGGDSEALDSAGKTASEALKNPELGSQDLLDQARQLRDVVGAFLAENEQDSRFDAVVVEHSKQGIDRGRAWTKAMGFEPNPDAVAELPYHLKADPF